ncbi:MAG: glycosyltransferase family 8 protein [Bacteroidetes bacterium]|nr:glycosyltransferase family 8 protein [Bacteroidota bacterium]
MVQSYNIATSTDANYFVPMYVMLFSLFKNNKDLNFNIYILYSGINERQKQEAESLAAQYSNTIVWLPVNDISLEQFYTSVYITQASYYRIFLPKLLPADIETILYLDADIIINGSIKTLLVTDISNYPIAATKEAVPHNPERLGIGADYDYFNAGVLLINIALWKQHNYSQQLIDNIGREHSNYLMHDQDALNTLFHKKVMFLSAKWNHQTGFYHLSQKDLEKRYDDSAINILNNAVIIHYTTHSKPWQYNNTHPYKQLFLQYISQTPYSYFIEKGNVILWCKKIGIRIKHKLKKIL